MLINQIKQDITTALGSPRRIIYGYLGIPGIGKTEMIQQAAAELGLAFHGDMVLSTMSALDIVANVPDAATRQLVPYPSSRIPTGTEPCVWFLDEFTNASPDTLKALQQGLLSGVFGNARLNPNAVIILAGNRKAGKAGSLCLSTAIYNRVVWRDIEFTADMSDAAVAYLVGKYGRHELAAYWYQNPMTARDFTGAMERLGSDSYTQWASPRSVELLFASGTPLTSIDDLAGYIGRSRAAALVAYTLTTYQTPDYAEAIAAPEAYPVPDPDPAIMSATASVFAARTTTDTLAATWAYIRRLPRPFQAVYLKLVAKLHRSVESSGGWLALIATDEVTNLVMGK